MPKNNGISDEERELFQKSVQDVKPLTSTNQIQKSSSSTTHLDLPSSRPPTVFEKQFIPLSSYIVEPVNAETLLHFHHLGVSKKQLDMLRKGHYPIEARLDLHGCTPNDAEEALCSFIAQHQLHHRHVLIIHGKGGRFGEAPVIKNLVNRWLPQFPQVLAFHSALAKHGGAGALYVLLKSISKS